METKSPAQVAAGDGESRTGSTISKNRLKTSYPDCQI
jgi:hypothetical protein